MRTALPFVLLSLAISSVSFAQTNSFDIASFARPDFDRRVLDVSGSLDGDNRYIGEDADNSEASSDFGANLRGSMRRYLNDSSSQFLTYLSLSTFLSYVRESSDSDLDNKASAIWSGINYNRSNRHYYKPNRFYELNVDGQFSSSYNANVSKYTSSPDEVMKSNSQGGFLFLPIKMGTGRLEFVQDARHAVIIEQALLEKGRLTEPMDNETMYEFADMISELKNQRFYDSRLQNIRELEAVDAFLNERGLLNTCDAQYFATLSDMWDFGRGPFRESGKRLSFFLEPGVYLRDQRTETETGEFTSSTERQTYAAMASAGVDFVHARPLSVQWQNDAEVHAVFGVSKGSTNQYDPQENFDSFTTPSFRLGASQAWGYFPNTRTEVQFFCGVDYVNYLGSEDLNEEISQNVGHGVFAKAGLEANYYISPRTRFSAFYDAFVNWSSTEESGSSFNDPLTLIYYLRNYSDFFRVDVDQTAVQQMFSISLRHSIY